MTEDSIELSLLSLFALVSFFITLITCKLFSKFANGLLLDKDFNKPQAFHKEEAARSGGIAIFLSMIIFFIFYQMMYDSILIKYLIIGISFFLLGFLDDTKINTNAYIRLAFMFLILAVSVIFLKIDIYSVDLSFLNNLLNFKVFSVLFLILCFMFIVNGSNLIDGFNGLLAIHLIIINSLLLLVNLEGDQTNLFLIITAQIIALFCFLFFNFPKAQMFLGDSGSYFLGSITALNVIETNNLNASVSSFFYCSILFYLFFEVFFSFFRKMYIKKSPFKPDRLHLHMLCYRYLERLKVFKDNNYISSLLINLTYFILITPAIYFKSDGVFCRVWFLALMLIYLIFYSRLKIATKEKL